MGDPSEKSPEEMRVGDIMIPLAEYPTLPVWATMREAIELMVKAQLVVGGRRSLPRTILLFDLDGSLSGTVRRRDLMRGLEPRFLVSQPLDYRKKLFDVSIDPNLSMLPFERVVEGVREQAERPVTDVMRPFERTIDYDDHILKAVYEMVTLDRAILPVVKDNKIVGVVRTADLFQELAAIVLGSDRRSAVEE